MGMKRKLLILASILLVAAIAVFAFMTLRASAPNTHGAAPYKDGERVSLQGETVCLNHTKQDGPQTLECMMGIRDKLGTYYAIRDTTEGYRWVSKMSSARSVKVDGIYRPSNDTKYLQSGTIELISVEEVN